MSELRKGLGGKGRLEEEIRKSKTKQALPEDTVKGVRGGGRTEEEDGRE
jgi:hypothetical protein